MVLACATVKVLMVNSNLNQLCKESQRRMGSQGRRKKKKRKKEKKRGGGGGGTTLFGMGLVCVKFKVIIVGSKPDHRFQKYC